MDYGKLISLFIATGLIYTIAIPILVGVILLVIRIGNGDE